LKFCYGPLSSSLSPVPLLMLSCSSFSSLRARATIIPWDPASLILGRPGLLPLCRADYPVSSFFDFGSSVFPPFLVSFFPIHLDFFLFFFHLQGRRVDLLMIFSHSFSVTLPPCSNECIPDSAFVNPPFFSPCNSFFSVNLSARGITIEVYGDLHPHPGHAPTHACLASRSLLFCT